MNVNDPDYDDPIMAELRAIREAHAAKFNYDIDAMFADMLARPRDPNVNYVSYPAKRITPVPIEIDPEARYDVVISWSKKVRRFVVQVPELEGCLAYGESYEKAAANAAISMTFWLQRARAEGRPIPPPRECLVEV